MRSLLVALCLALAIPVAAQTATVIAALENLLKTRPEDPTLWYYLSRFQVEAGDKKAAVAALKKVDELGEGFLPPREFGFEAIWDNKEFQAVRSKLEARLPRLDFAPTAFEIDDRGLIPEGIAYDPGTASFFVGSIAQKRIVRVAPGGVVTEFAGKAANLDYVLGLALDSPRRTLYAVSTTAITEAGEKERRNTVVGFDADTGKVVLRAEVPGAQQLNDVTVARGGRVFVSDSASGAVYEILKSGAPHTVLPAGQARGTNGLAVSPDVKRLYIGHSTGIAMVDLATGKMTRVTPPARETVAGIDGLYEWEGQLVGVQNVTTPGRVIVMTLSPDGTAITRVQTLLSHHHPSLDEPTTGAVTSHGFYLLAATGVNRFNREGKIERPDTVPKPTVLRVLLSR
jgi:hypothetical protein